jgi:hypothetical protein
MLKLPPPVTFNDGERKKYGALMAVAGVCYGLAAITAACVVIWGTWPESLAKLRLYFVGGAMLMASAGSILVTIALAVGGPVGRVKTRVSKDGLEAEAEGDADK